MGFLNGTVISSPNVNQHVVTQKAAPKKRRAKKAAPKPSEPVAKPVDDAPKAEQADEAPTPEPTGS